MAAWPLFKLGFEKGWPKCAGRTWLLYIASLGQPLPPCLPPPLPIRAAPHSLEGKVTLASILAYTLCFALGSGPIPWVALPEILPQEIKGNAQVGGPGPGPGLAWVGGWAAAWGGAWCMRLRGNLWRLASLR